MKEIAYQKFIGGGNSDLLRIRIWTKNGKVVDLVVQYESLIDGHWHIILRYDCSHGYFHRDIIFPNGDKVKQEVIISNLKEALNYSEQDIRDRHEFYKERYIKKMKK